MKRQSILILLILSIFFLNTEAQVAELSEESNFSDRVFFGSSLDIAYNEQYALVGISPFLGYTFTNTTSIGVGSTYQLLSFYNSGITTDMYGYRAYLMQKLVASFFIYAEYENLSRIENVFIADSKRVWEDNKYLGLGYLKKLNQKTGLFVMGLYNFDLRNNVGLTPWSFRLGLTYNAFHNP